MKKVKYCFAPIGFCFSLLMTAFLLIGCEDGKDTAALTVQPGEVELESDGDTAKFTVVDGLRDLSYPLEWSVDNPALGCVIASEGDSAVYQRSASGVNVLRVKDQYGAKGYATITQGVASEPGEATDYSIILLPHPNPIPNGEDRTHINVQPGRSVGPYTWSVEDQTMGHMVETNQATASATYQSYMEGKNTVTVEDANHVTGSITIEQLGP